MSLKNKLRKRVAVSAGLLALGGAAAVDGISNMFIFLDQQEMLSMYIPTRRKVNQLKRELARSAASPRGITYDEAVRGVYEGNFDTLDNVARASQDHYKTYFGKKEELLNFQTEHALQLQREALRVEEFNARHHKTYRSFFESLAGVGMLTISGLILSGTYLTDNKNKKGNVQ